VTILDHPVNAKSRPHRAGFLLLRNVIDRQRRGGRIRCLSSRVVSYKPHYCLRLSIFDDSLFKNKFPSAQAINHPRFNCHGDIFNGVKVVLTVSPFIEYAQRQLFTCFNPI